MKKMMIVCLTAVAALLMQLSAVARSDDLYHGLKGWIWVNHLTPSGAPQAPLNYQFNSKRAINYVRLAGTGQYIVTFPRLATDGGNVQVSAYGGAHYCAVAGWGPAGEDLSVKVNCYSPTGAPFNGSFTAFLYKEQGVSIYNRAHVLANADGSLAPGFQWNARGGANTGRKLAGSAGRYEVFLPSIAMGIFSSDGGVPTVSAFGSVPARAEVDNWMTTAAGTWVRIRTFDLGGTPMDAAFSLNFADDVGFGINVAEDRLNMYGGYVFADHPADGMYNPSVDFNNITAEPPSEVRRLAMGSYQVRFSALKDRNKTTALVTAIGRRGEYCTLGGWWGAGGTDVFVNCYNAAGEPVDSRFTLTYLTDDTVLW